MHLFKMILFTLFVSSTLYAQKPSNFEGNYLDAMEKAKQSKKICAVVFSEDNNRASAYTNTICFEDVNVKKQINQNYVGVASNAKDFDGKILMKRWQLNKVPSVALVGNDGKLIASVNHGLSKAKMAEFLQFYSLPGNAGKSVDQSDPQFEIEVREWQGYKGSIEEDPIIVQKDEIEESAVANNVVTTPPAKPGVKPTVVKEETKIVQTQTTTKSSIEPETKKTIVAEKEEVVATRTVKTEEVANAKWLVQAGVFGAEASAKALVGKINSNGGKGSIEKIDQGDKIIYKVIAGKFVSETEARDLIARLSGAGIQSFIKVIN